MITFLWHESSIPAASYCDPVASCDKCGERIENAESAVVLRKRRDDESTFGEVAFLHKGKCDETYRHENQAERYDELSNLLFRLCRNVGMGPKELGDAAEQVAILERL